MGFAERPANPGMMPTICGMTTKTHRKAKHGIRSLKKAPSMYFRDFDSCLEKHRGGELRTYQQMKTKVV